MTHAFVVGASVAVAWVHPGQATPENAAMLDAVADSAILEVPALWRWKWQTLTVLARQRKLSEEGRQTGLGWLAVEHDLSVYDAAYLELAERRNLALACNDQPLRKAATRRGVRLWTSPRR